MKDLHTRAAEVASSPHSFAGEVISAIIKELMAKPIGLRDHFAGQALVGLLGSGIAEQRGQTHGEIADVAYINADAMLAERAKS